MLGLKPADRQLLGIRLLVDLSQPNLLIPLSAASSAVVPLPIPNSAAVRGARIYAQSAHAVDQRIRRAEDRLARELERAGHKHQLRAIPNPMRGEEGT